MTELTSEDVMLAVDFYMECLYYKYVRRYHPVITGEQYKDAYDRLVELASNLNMDYFLLIETMERFLDADLKDDLTIMSFVETITRK